MKLALRAPRQIDRSSRIRIVSAVAEALERRTLLTAVVVNTPLDVTDPRGSSRVSLLDAIAIANSSKTPTSIKFDASVFATPQTITLFYGKDLELKNRKSTTITGPSAALTISGDGKSDIFFIAKGGTAKLSGLTLTDGAGFNSTYDYLGGAVSNNGNLTITDSIITDNNAGESTYGGGIRNAADAALDLIDSTISGNSSFSGGGLANYGTATLTGVTVSDNKATYGEPGHFEVSQGVAGGIFNGGTMTLSDSTVSGNTSPSAGGGIYNQGKLTLLDSTISGNSAVQGAVGGLGNFSSSPGAGGGLYQLATTGAVASVANSIIAGNTSQGPGPDVDGTVTSLGSNLIGDATASTGWKPSDLIGTSHPIDPLLQRLGSFGGPTQTMPPLPASPAIAHGSVALLPVGLTTDQRGLLRVVNGRLDSGAVETQAIAVSFKAPPANQIAVESESSSFSLGQVLTSGSALTVDVNWGDGSADTVLALPAGAAIPSASHAFSKAGTYTVSVDAFTSAGQEAQVGSFKVKAIDAPLSANGLTLAEAPGLAVDPVVATFTDADANAVASDYKATIYWGDGRTSVGSISGLSSQDIEVGATVRYTVSAAHTFAKGGSYVTTVVITDVGGATATVHDRVTVGPFDLRRIVVNSTADQTDAAGSSVVTMRDAVNVANASAVPTTIAFDLKVFSSPQTIVLANDLELSGSTTTTIIGPAAGLEINGGRRNVALVVDAGAAVRLFNLSLVDGGFSTVNTFDTASGGMANFGTAWVYSCTFTGNEGYGISNSGVMTAVQCTISPGGSASSYYEVANDGTMTVLDSTVIGNTPSLGSSVGSIGVSLGAGASLTLGNSIVAENEDDFSARPPLALTGMVTSLGNNLIGGADGGIGWKASDLVGTTERIDPHLAPLGRYGGATDTQPPLPGSPAIDHGSNALVPAGTTTDQRGAVRIVGGTVDIGSAEFRPGDGTLAYTGPAAQTSVEGKAATFSPGSFSLTGAQGPFTCDINWGDKSPDTLLTVSKAGTLPRISHTFADATVSMFGDNPYKVTVTVTDADDAFVVGAPFNVTVDDAPLSGRALPVTFAAGIPFAPILATFTDANPLAVTNGSYSFSVAWGDGTTSVPLAIDGYGSYPIQNGHTYKTPGVYTFTVTIQDFAGGSTPLIVSNKATVVPPRPVTIVVNSTLDQTNPPGSPIVTLRDAFALADANPNPTSITFDPAVFATHQTIALKGELDFSGEPGTVVEGPKAGLTLQGQTLVVEQYGDLTVSNLTIEGAAGSGIANEGGTLTASNVIVTANYGANYGQDYAGGIFNEGTTTLTNSTVSGSLSSGIYNEYNLTLTGDTISGNACSGSGNANGGGIYNSGTLTAINTTIADNSTGDQGTGGGLQNLGTAALYDSTITGNTASGGGGGIYVETDSQYTEKLTVGNTVIAGNTAASGDPTVGPDVAGPVTSLGHNLVGQDDDSTGWRSTDITGAYAHQFNLDLGPLANNGGPTLTVLPLPGSRAINHGSVSQVPKGITTDQRGLPRISQGKLDIGAVQA